MSAVFVRRNGLRICSITSEQPVEFWDNGRTWNSFGENVTACAGIYQMQICLKKHTPSSRERYFSTRNTGIHSIALIMIACRFSFWNAIKWSLNKCILVTLSVFCIKWGVGTEYHEPFDPGFIMIINSREDISPVVNQISANNLLTELCVVVLQQPNLVESVEVIPVGAFVFFKLVLFIIQICVVFVEVFIVILHCVDIEWKVWTIVTVNHKLCTGLPFRFRNVSIGVVFCANVSGCILEGFIFLEVAMVAGFYHQFWRIMWIRIVCW